MVFRRPTLLVVPRGDCGFSSSARCCPRCSSALYRVARRLPDLLLGLFIPLHRYRCISLQCSWEGSFRERPVRLPNQVIGGRAKCPAAAVANP